jgi:hypothetical protein
MIIGFPSLGVTGDNGWRRHVACVGISPGVDQVTRSAAPGENIQIPEGLGFLHMERLSAITSFIFESNRASL